MLISDSLAKNHRNVKSDNEQGTPSLRERLEGLLNQAKHNEKKLRRFQSLELHLIGLGSLNELILSVLYPSYSIFNWDVVTLMLFDPEYEMQRILESEGLDISDHPSLQFATSQEGLDSVYSISLFPTLGAYVPRKHSLLFPKKIQRPSSIALLPLVRNGKLIGSLNIGSFDKSRFVRGVRADFFEHLAAVVAICLENATYSDRLKRQGLVDTLTSVNNRRFFDQRLTEELENAYRNNKALSCMMMDIDYFKRVNDSYGHQVGDRVLRKAAKIIREQLRGSDVLARYGGEEFVALLSSTEKGVATDVAERIRVAIKSENFVAGNDNFSVSISIGLATYRPEIFAGDKRLADERLLACADRLLYSAKAGGRNCVICDELVPDG